MVYGRPALAAAIGRRVEGEFEVAVAEECGTDGDKFGAGTPAAGGPPESGNSDRRVCPMPSRGAGLSLRYREGAREVWPKDIHNALLAAFEKLSLPRGCWISGEIAIPEGLLGAGLGSSAAVLATAASVLVFASNGFLTQCFSEKKDFSATSAKSRNPSVEIAETQGAWCFDVRDAASFLHPFAQSVVSLAAEADSRVHGKGSGLDATTVVSGGLVCYRPHKAPDGSVQGRFYREDPQGGGAVPRFLREARVALTTRQKNTRSAVACVRALVDSPDPDVSGPAAREIQRIGELTEKAISLAIGGAGGEDVHTDGGARGASCVSERERSFFDLVNRNQESLRALGVSCDEIERAVDWFLAEGWAAAKLTGAGQGGAVLGFGRPGERGVSAEGSALAGELPEGVRIAFEAELGGPGLSFSAERVR